MDKMKITTTGALPIILTCGDHVIICPYATKIPVIEGNLEKRLRIDAQPCWSNCPHFNIIEVVDNELMTINISCGGQKNQLTAFIEAPNENQLKIIKNPLKTL